MRSNKKSPVGLTNDNWVGYAQNWIYDQEVTWMEKTVSSPHWTGLTVFTIGAKGQERRKTKQHLMHEKMFSADVRTAFKGQIFSAPMDWKNIINQLEQISSQESYICHPMDTRVLAARVQLQIHAGLVDLNSLIKQATVRRHIIVQLIRMWRDAGHPDYKNAFLEKGFHQRLHALNPINKIEISMASQPCLNGTYKKQDEMKNDRLWYKHDTGACILYDDDNKHWILRYCEDATDSVYSSPQRNDNNGPPNGEWHGHHAKDMCAVKTKQSHVLITKARLQSLNGLYIQQEQPYNDHSWYEHKFKNACIIFEEHTKEWILKSTRNNGHAIYRPEPPNNDISPPNGEWNSHNGKESCHVRVSDNPTIPPDILGILNNEDEADLYEGVDKAATPAERLQTTTELKRELERSRPLSLVAQRDSDANKEIKHSRDEAWATLTEMKIATGSNLVDQFVPSYLPRVFHLAMPYLVGGPDLPRHARPRRGNDNDSEFISLNKWVKFAASNCLTQFRWDWDLVPGAWSLNFASEVNTSMTLSINRAMKRGGADEMIDNIMHKHITNILKN